METGPPFSLKPRLDPSQPEGKKRVRNTDGSDAAHLQKADLSLPPSQENDNSLSYFSTRMRVSKMQNKAAKQSSLSACQDDESNHNTAPPDAKANAQSPAIFSGDGIKKSMQLAGDVL